MLLDLYIDSVGTQATCHQIDFYDFYIYIQFPICLTVFSQQQNQSAKQPPA